MDIQSLKEFEAWWSENYDRDDFEDVVFSEILNEYESNYIVTDDLNKAWSAWQAAKAPVVPEWISVEDQLPPNDPYNREYWVYETLNNKVQHDYWVCPDTELEQEFEPFFNNWLRKVTHWMPMVKYPKPPVQAQEPDND